MSQDFDPYYDFRDRLVEAVTRDLSGPTPSDDEQEVIPDAPLTQYVVGILYPQSGEAIDAAQDVDLDDDYDEVANPDPPVAMANVRYPSSMGMTFAVDPATAAEVLVQVEASRYVLEESEEDEPEPQPRSRRQSPGGAHGRWRRVPLKLEPLPIPVSTPVDDARVTLDGGLELFYRVRRADSAGAVPVTIALLNTAKVKPGGGRDADAVFQARLKVSAEDQGPCFVERSGAAPLATDEDLRAYRLLYRDSVGFAIGHGCSAEWDAGADLHRATEIRTAYIPRFELRLADSNQRLDSPILRIRRLAEAEREDVIRGLEDFCASYSSWITERRNEIDSLPADLRSTAADHLDYCEKAADRMKDGVRLLASEDGELAWRAFRLANKAMLRQRARVEWLRSDRSAASPSETGDHSWRPFQLAFILLCLRGIAAPSSDDRRLADLLWFPTGGGKTEAYLGLIAFTVFLRRLQHGDRGAGINVLMRYTMRLLTVQQFERAALLICSLESIRREETELGREEISIGLWVGQDATPNTRADARRSLDRLHAGRTVEKKNPVQVQACPWCGTPFDHRNYWLTTDNSRLMIACRNDDCLFGRGLPVFVVDEDIYDHHPTLVVATADKFASLPWREQVAALFNLDLENVLPPELIIQDELHLISGPLGTLTGLYETAVDLLCTHEGAPPKVVASTATIRRAREQTKGLFNREVRQFPPPAIDASNSYFAVEAPPDEKGTRLYVGVMAPGISQTTLLVRTYAALLQRVLDLEGTPQAKDPYWTLVGYFNSLRVLGGARMQVQDDVDDRLELLAKNSPKREIQQRIELTSREPSAAIPTSLRHMAVRHPDQAALDVILATNMISVGVDIDRLGLMVVMGQPQATSEYIQATSRVGRTYPGLVLTLFNSARSRDRSHYESFVTYHSALYRQVESTSVTPFSPRARDRGLHAVVIALARMLVEELRSNDGAGNDSVIRERIQNVREAILERVGAVAPDEVEATERQLDEVLEAWLERADQVSRLVFNDYSHPDRSLLIDASRDDLGHDGAFGTLWSLRDVDRASNLFEVRN